MWLEVKHMRIDEHGRQRETEITLNMDRVVAYTELKNGKTRLLFEIGHDIADHRSARWMDILNSKEEIDEAMNSQTLAQEPVTEG
jgi:hypothetical protein